MLIQNKNELKAFEKNQCLWIGIPSIEYTKGGKTFIACYSGGVKEEIGNYVLLFRSEDGIGFGEPIAACFEEAHRCFDPTLWIDPLGRLWFMWARYPDEGVYGVICDDPDADELVFGEEFLIGHNVMMNRPTVLSDGRWAFPVARWREDAFPLRPQNTGGVPVGAHFYVTEDRGKSFKRLGAAIVEERQFDEHMFLELDNGDIRCFVRTSYGIGACDSSDGGNTWGKDFDTGLGGPGSRFHIRRLPSGRVLLINHYDFNGRNNLHAMLSEDGGKTFPHRLLLDSRSSISYPDAALDGEGRIHIVYDRERGYFKNTLAEVYGDARELLTACITEEDILAGEIKDEGSYLRRVAVKMADYEGKLKEPFDLKY